MEKEPFESFNSPSSASAFLEGSVLPFGMLADDGLNSGAVAFNTVFVSEVAEDALPFACAVSGPACVDLVSNKSKVDRR